MRKHFFCLLLISLAINTKGQIVDTLYYNANWELVSIGSGDYYRVAEIDTINLRFTGKIKDYYRSGEVALEGQYSPAGKKYGEFVSYYSSGRINSIGTYKDDSLAGIWHYYYENGTLKERINFLSKHFVVDEYNDDEGNSTVVDGTGIWQKTFSGEYNYLTLTAQFENGKRSDTWTLKEFGGYRLVKETYKNGAMQKGILSGTPSKKYHESVFRNDMFYPQSFDNIEAFKIGNCYRTDYSYIEGIPDKPIVFVPSNPGDSVGVNPSTTSDELFVIIEQPATYPGGIGAFYTNIMQNLKYPEKAQRMGLEGKVFIEFVVEKDGSVTNVKVLKGIGAGCDEEAVEVIKNSGKWVPGKQHGKPVRQRMVLPITFRLS
jgi:TonB family protein